MKVRLRYYRKRLSSFFKTKTGKRILKWGQYLFNTAILVWLVYELTDIGWLKVWNSLPLNPVFYLLFLFLYFQLPFFEIFIYRITWTFDWLKSIPVFLLKKIYNKDLLGYSGEVYFYVWARNNLNLTDSEVLKTIKDNNIISSVASTLVAIGLLSAFLFTDQIKIVEWFARQDQAYFWGGAIFLVVLVILFVHFRHQVISMPMKSAFSIFGIQTFRLILGQAVNVLMYYVVMPETPLYVWFTLLSVEIVLTRIPFIPNQDLIYVGMSIGIAEGLAVSTSDIAALMLTKGVLNKAFNFLAFGLSAWIKESSFVPDVSELAASEETESQK
ncbi:hypothetical protein [Gracilimonas mengyeensis]|uniref:hypothetical protein n=1 Tax=Gracilimonas mengyeensis TaxID=1302730 RepID=UPI001159E2D2|nr:hypothetical protein [Gracilimonas mengyeensis]